MSGKPFPPNAIDEHIGQRMQLRRTMMGMSQKDLAKLCGVTFQQIQKYEKTIADINARTSIIQEEDRTLELRLKQLDTEQSALSTEMEAVKKVIKDNVEKTFKTFSD